MMAVGRRVCFRPYNQAKMDISRILLEPRSCRLNRIYSFVARVQA